MTRQLCFSNNLCSAFVAEVVRAFQKTHHDGYLGRTAMQKLIYFSQSIGVPIPCSFEIYNYGPYSDEVTFSVEALLADNALRDASLNSSRYSKYELVDNDLDFPDDIKEKVHRYRPQIEKVVRVLGNFEPQQLELIATLHFIARKLASLEKSSPSKAQVLDNFAGVKRDKFKRGEVEAWYDALQAAGLV